MTFEEYLISKKIDSKKFSDSEWELWNSWSSEFQQMHPNSFTMQKLNLINPIRRKYPLPETAKPAPKNQETTSTEKPVPKAFKPVIKPKPKIQ